MIQITLDKPGQFSRHDAAEPAPDAGHALVRVHRIGVCGTDLHAFAGRQPFFQYPRILGHELGVEVVHVPRDDRGLAAGDRCAVEPYLHCGACIACRRGRTNCCTQLRVLGVHIDGGMRALLSVPIDKLHKSDKLSLDQLALVETLGIGAHAVERAAPEAGETALVVGAGPIGLSVIQFLQLTGARVLVMDVSAERLKFCRDVLGVQETVNAASENEPLEQLRRLTHDDLPTLVLDATGNAASMMRSFNLIAHGGRLVFVGLFQGDVTFHDPDFHRRELTLLASRNATAATFTRIIDLIERGRIDTTPWITHRLPLAGVVERFSTLPGAPGLIKAMIEVE